MTLLGDYTTINNYLHHLHDMAEIQFSSLLALCKLCYSMKHKWAMQDLHLKIAQFFIFLKLILFYPNKYASACDYTVHKVQRMLTDGLQLQHIFTKHSESKETQVQILHNVVPLN